MVHWHNEPFSLMVGVSSGAMSLHLRAHVWAIPHGRNDGLPAAGASVEVLSSSNWARSLAQEALENGITLPSGLVHCCPAAMSVIPFSPSSLRGRTEPSAET